MSSYIYNYEEWLSGHANRKTMMQKLERSLVPYEIFEAIGLQNDKQKREGEVCLNGNTYAYTISYDYRCIGNDVYDAQLRATRLTDKWNNRLMGYNKFKVVMNHENVKTIYADHEDYFQQVVEMFERDDYAALYAQRSAYINNLLARYLLLRLLETFHPELQLLTVVETQEDGRIPVLAANANRSEWIMYAFSKREARELAERLDGACRNLTVVYFFNQDFERDGNIVGYDSGATRIVSARGFMLSLPMETMERRLFEKRMLLLVSLLYNDHLEWRRSRIERIVMNPTLPDEQKKKGKAGKKTAKKHQRNGAQGQPWYRKISRTLLEDALNVLGDEPTTHADVFHYLCAANLVNAYVNQCNSNPDFSGKQVTRMFQAKRQIFKCLIRLAEEGNPNVRIAVCDGPGILTNITVEKREFQISFRGMKREDLDRILASGNCSRGKFGGVFLQPIATALYQYSYLQRWKGLSAERMQRS